jgi:hypothetical protein
MGGVMSSERRLVVRSASGVVALAGVLLQLACGVAWAEGTWRASAVTVVPKFCAGQIAVAAVRPGQVWAACGAAGEAGGLYLGRLTTRGRFVDPRLLPGSRRGLYDGQLALAVNRAGVGVVAWVFERPPEGEIGATGAAVSMFRAGRQLGPAVVLVAAEGDSEAHSPHVAINGRGTALATVETGASSEVLRGASMRHGHLIALVPNRLRARNVIGAVSIIGMPGEGFRVGLEFERSGLGTGVMATQVSGEGQFAPSSEPVFGAEPGTLDTDQLGDEATAGIAVEAARGPGSAHFHLLAAVRSRSGGRPFAPAQIVGPAYPEEARESWRGFTPQAVLSPGGRLVVVWQELHDIMTSSGRVGGSLGSARDVAPGAVGYELHVVETTGGRVLAIWRQPRSLGGADETSTLEGAIGTPGGVFGPVHVLAPRRLGERCQQVVVAPDQVGDVFVTWECFSYSRRQLRPMWVSVWYRP